MLIAHRNGMATSVTLYRWIRMHISKVKANAGQVQLSEIKMLDNGGGVYAWPEGTTCYNTTSHSNSGTFGTGQTPDKLIDGNTSTKMCAINLGSTNYFGFDIYIDLGECVFDAQKWCKWCWYTADDNPGRDPVTFSLYLSTDAETWIPVDSCADVSITTTRDALAYTGDINLNMEYVKTGLVAWWDGEWNAGGGVHDAAATTWKDLAGNSHITINGTWGEKWLDGSGSIVFDIYKDVCNAQSMTIDFCSEVSGPNGHWFFRAGNDGSNSWYSADGVPYKWLRIHSGLNEVGSLLPQIGERVNASIVISSSSKRGWINGNDVIGVAYTPSIPVTSTDFMIGYKSGTWSQKTMSFRIYNRPLTAAEVAANYAIDKARFNLP